MIPDLRSTRAAAFVALLSVVAAGGCGTGTAPELDAATAETPRPPNQLERLLSTDNGLQMRRWVVRGATRRVDELLLEAGRPYDADSGLAAALQRNGFLLVAVPRAELDRLQEDVGGVGEILTDMRIWHGQAPQWRETQRVALMSDLAVLLDGRARVFPGGTFRLMLRAWTMPMEGAPLMQVELVPQYERPAPRNYRTLLGPQPLGGEVFREMLVELQLVTDTVWVLTSDGPGFAAGGPTSASTTGPSAMAIGPDVIPPPTLGELLFVEPGSGLRSLLVFEAVLPGSADGAAELLLETPDGDGVAPAPGETSRDTPDSLPLPLPPVAPTAEEDVWPPPSPLQADPAKEDEWEEITPGRSGP